MAKKFRAKFAGHGVQIDGAPVNSPTGKSIAQKTLRELALNVPSVSDKDLEHLGSYPGDIVETDAMCDVDANGVENKPQGVKVPGSAKPTDGYMERVSSTIDSIAESMDQVDEDALKCSAPVPTYDQNDGDGMEVETTSSSVTEDEEGELTMEDVFNDYSAEKDEVSHPEFSQHCDDLGYECPSEDDMNDLMANDQNHSYAPTPDGTFAKTPIILQIDLSDIPGFAAQAAGAQDQPAINGEVEDIAPPPAGPAPSVPAPTGEAPAGGDLADDFEAEDTLPQSEDSSDEEEVEECNMTESSVTEDSVTTAQIAAPPTTEPKIAKGKVQKAGNAATAVEGLKKLGDPLKKDIKNDDNIAEGKKFILPKSVSANIVKITESVNVGVSKLPADMRAKLQYRVAVKIGDSKKVGKFTSNINEAAADAEELAVIGKYSPTIEAVVLEGTEKLAYVETVVPKLMNRKPVCNKNGLLFRYQHLANNFAKNVISESVAYKIEDHPFGTIIKTDVDAVRPLMGV